VGGRGEIGGGPGPGPPRVGVRVTEPEGVTVGGWPGGEWATVLKVGRELYWSLAKADAPKMGALVHPRQRLGHDGSLSGSLFKSTSDSGWRPRTL
jgi:hypothetical protein